MPKYPSTEVPKYPIGEREKEEREIGGQRSEIGGQGVVGVHGRFFVLCACTMHQEQRFTAKARRREGGISYASLLCELCVLCG